MLLGIAEDRPWLYHTATGVRIPDRTELQQALETAETQVRAETQARLAAEARAQELEARLQALEAQMRR